MMATRSTTAIPENRIRMQRQIDYDDADGNTLDIWTPANGKRIYINDVLLSVLNSHASAHVIVAVQVYIGSSWETLLPIAVPAQSAVNFAHNFGQRIRSGDGNGTDARIRVVHQGGSDDWQAIGGVTGEER